VAPFTCEFLLDFPRTTSLLKLKKSFPFFFRRRIKGIDAIRTGIIMLRVPPSTPRHFIRDDRETGQNPHGLIASVRVYTYGAA
jgi:hypothetical protein